MKKINMGGLACLVIILGYSHEARADKSLFGIACRSVHLSFPAPSAKWYYHEITVRQSAPGTYFSVCVWNQGYFGIQELGNGKKLLLFSVWDPGSQDDPKSVAVEKRVQMHHRDPEVRVGRFGGEGTGGQSFFDYNWKLGETYRFAVASQRMGERTQYAGFFFHPDQKQWRHLITFSTITDKKSLGGYNCFVEDFQRNRVSATKTRAAEFANGWVRDELGNWHELSRAKFTGDSNPATNVNAVLQGDHFLLCTGGNIRNTDAKLNSSLERPKTSSPPTDLPTWPRN